MMILAFEFHYVSHNGVLENFLFQALEDNPLPFSLTRKETVLSLCVEGEEEALLSFSDKLGATLPLSLFFRSLHVRVADALEKESMARPECHVSLPFTPKMLGRVLEEGTKTFFDPFVAPEFGLAWGAQAPLVFAGEKETLSSEAISYAALFEAAAKHMVATGALHVKSASGWYRAVPVTQQVTYEEGKTLIMPCDLSVVEKMVVIKEDEIKALASLEKPLLRLNINAIYAQKGFLETPFVSMKMADDLLLYLLCLSLFREGVEFVALSPSAPAEANALYGQGGQVRENIGVTVLENGEFVPVFGEVYANPVLQKTAQAFEHPSHGRFTALLKEHRLFQKSVGGFYFSQTHDDAVMVYQESHGMVDLLHVTFPETIGALLDEIATSTSGERLVENYTKEFPELVAHARGISLANEPKSIATLMGAAGVLFGYGKSVQEALKVMLDNALLYSGMKGPRIDFLVQGETLKGAFHAARIVRSGMSYRLAGADAYTLSFGYLDSLAHFTSDTLDRLKEEFGVTHVGFCGSLFGNKRMAEGAARHAKVAFTICFNQEIPIDA